ncbi:MAG: dTDP-glucose 4,6-dehydratase [Alphaproteobacteria bacterium CG1_02_46_17]|nr:MAG: dTDP-glucose 4,6-dehydratase [Alphaproteobacteria bacterium CG1_02_46_17]
MTIFVTGGAGFIGSNFVRHWLTQSPDQKTDPIVVIDKLTYAGNISSLEDSLQTENVEFILSDIGDTHLISSLLEKYDPRAIINFAAESHVDRSIHAPEDFIQTNVVATNRLLQAAHHWWSRQAEHAKQNFRFLHISTDEVYGSLLETMPPVTEESSYRPNNPYSASKAASDHLVRAYHHTYGLPVLTTNCSNNYGPYQFPEKLIPLIIRNALDGKSLPVYGDGQNVRDWLYVTDHCQAICKVLEKGRIGEVYNIGGSNEMKNIDVVRMICSILDKNSPRTDGKPYENLITHVEDRKGHDRRYAIDSTKIERELNWRPNHDFESGLRKTVMWYLENRGWISDVTKRHGEDNFFPHK